MAICIKEFLGSDSFTNSEERVQIFATDLSEGYFKSAQEFIKNEVTV
jgi:chemotaxis methyl-accepting protein methylase